MLKKIIIIGAALVIITVVILVAIPWGNYESDIEKSELSEKIEFSNDEQAEPPSLDKLEGVYSVDITKGGTAEILFNTDGLKATYGGFDKFQISFNVPDNYKESTIEVKIETASLNTANEMRDEHLREEEFFDVKKYPQTIFSGTSVTLGDTSYIAKGELTLNGTKKVIDVPFLHLGAGGEGKNAFEAFEGSFKLDRTKYGQMESSGVGNIVKVNFYCELKAE